MTMLMGSPKLPVLLALFKGDPLVNVAGAYFPAWLACMLAGVLGSWLVSRILARAGLPEALRPAPLMLPALFLAITCTAWLLLFSTR